MALQNRVTPMGEIVATPARGVEERAQRGRRALEGLHLVAADLGVDDLEGTAGPGHRGHDVVVALCHGSLRVR